MRRWISILLVCLLPVQVWAQAGAEKCPHAAFAEALFETAQAHHDSHQDHTLHAPPEFDEAGAGVMAASLDPAGSHHEHCGAGCHGGSSVATAESRWAPAVRARGVVPPWSMPTPDSPALAGPFRPPSCSQV